MNEETRIIETHYCDLPKLQITIVAMEENFPIDKKFYCDNEFCGKERCNWQCQFCEEMFE